MTNRVRMYSIQYTVSMKGTLLLISRSKGRTGLGHQPKVNEYKVTLIAS